LSPSFDRRDGDLRTKEEDWNQNLDRCADYLPKA
jgi:hypothetical protein